MFDQNFFSSILLSWIEGIVCVKFSGMIRWMSQTFSIDDLSSRPLNAKCLDDIDRNFRWNGNRKIQMKRFRWIVSTFVFFWLMIITIEIRWVFLSRFSLIILQKQWIWKYLSMSDFLWIDFKHHSIEDELYPRTHRNHKMILESQVNLLYFTDSGFYPSRITKNWKSMRFVTFSREEIRS